MLPDHGRLGHTSVQFGDALRLSVQPLITGTHLLGEVGNGAQVTVDVDRQRPTHILGTVDRPPSLRSRRRPRRSQRPLPLRSVESKFTRDGPGALQRTTRPRRGSSVLLCCTCINVGLGKVSLNSSSLSTSFSNFVTVTASILLLEVSFNFNAVFPGRRGRHALVRKDPEHDTWLVVSLNCASLPLFFVANVILCSTSFVITPSADSKGWSSSLWLPSGDGALTRARAWRWTAYQRDGLSESLSILPLRSSATAVQLGTTPG